MSVSVCVARPHSAGRVVSFVAAAVLIGAASGTALLAVTSIAAGSLVAVAANRPNALAAWTSAPRTPPTQRAASIFAEHEISFGQPTPLLGARLAALADALFEARAEPDENSAAVRTADQEGEALASAASSIRSVVAIASAPRIIAPQPPVEASAIPELPVVRLASLEPPAQAPIPPALIPPAALAERSASDDSAVAPLPKPRPLDLPRSVLRAPAAAPTAKPVALAYAAAGSEPESEGPGAFFRGLLGQGATIPLPDAKRGLAIYDISTATVRLPNGERLEAHSGLGHRQDNPAYVREKNRGPTPPNVYDLRMREALFHGAEAIRLTPRDPKRVFNRDGLLAHPYMYVGGGDRSQSNGCVVFKNYGRFLRAFKAGEVARLVVVPNMAALSTVMAGL